MKCYGPVVQLVERLTGSQEVEGSKPFCVHHAVKLGWSMFTRLLPLRPTIVRRPFAPLAEMIGTRCNRETSGLKGTDAMKDPMTEEVIIVKPIRQEAQRRLHIYQERADAMPEAINIYISSKDGLPWISDILTGTGWKRDEPEQIQ